jgi:hypothetical protein
MTNRSNLTLLEAAEKVYNSYLLLYKLNELKVGNGKLLQEVISEAINQNKTQIEFKAKGKQYEIQITKESNNYTLEVLGENTKPEVKNVLVYTDEEIIALWANSEVSIKKDENNNFAFAVGLHDQSRLRALKIGGLGKKVPFALRFANFYKVIEVFKDEGTPLEERLRIANNIVTGSGKTGDIALLKFWAYLANIPCVTAVPSNNLRTQSNNFDGEFLPDEVAQEFAEPFSETNAEYATITFAEAFNMQWNVLNDTYGKKGIYSISHRVNNLPGDRSRTAEEQYVKKYENTHLVLDHSEKRNQNLKRSIDAAGNGQEKSQLFLDFIDQTLDSQAYKVGLIASEQKYHNRDNYIKILLRK